MERKRTNADLKSSRSKNKSSSQERTVCLVRTKDKLVDTIIDRLNRGGANAGKADKKGAETISVRGKGHTHSPPRLRASSCCHVSLMAFLPSRAPGVSAGASLRTCASYPRPIFMHPETEVS